MVKIFLNLNCNVHILVLQALTESADVCGLWEPVFHSLVAVKQWLIFITPVLL